MDYVKLLKKHFSFLITDFSYELEKEENKNLYKSICFRNKTTERSVCIDYEIRNSLIDISIWKLKDNERDFEDRSSYIYLSNLLEMNEDKTQLPKLQYDLNLTDKELDGIFNIYIELLKQYALNIIDGKNWEVVPWIDSFNREYNGN